jgi:arylsulfatase A-like enzyme
MRSLPQSCLGALVFSLLLFSSFCQKDSREYRLIRLMDELSEKNILETPLKDLTSRFPHREEIISNENFILIPHGKSDGLSILAYPLKYPALGGAYAASPPEISVSAGRKTLPLTSSDKLKGKSWAFLKKERHIVINKIFFKGDKFRDELMLPSGTVMFGVSISNPQPLDYIPNLKFVLDGETAEEIPVQSQGYIKFSKEIKAGKHKLELYFDEGTNLRNADERGACLNLNSLQIICSTDLLLFPESSAGNSYKLSYFLEPDGFPEVLQENPELRDYASLYKIKNGPGFSIHDTGIRKNPFSVKRNLRFDGRVMNAIFAPPRSEFFFPSRLPDNSYLEFGLGLLNGPGQEQSGRVIFKISAEMGGQKTVLFQKTLGPLPDKKGPVFSSEKIDLHRLSNKKVKLSFLTEADPSLKADAQEHLGQAFWYNPIIYNPAQISAKPYNVILISIDTLRADHLGCYGYSRQTSPHIDRLATESVQFDNVFSATSWTLPAHLSLLTGLTLFHHGVLHESYAFDTSIPTLADLLRGQGYSTGAFTGGGYVSSRFGFAKGFDFYLDEGIPDLTSSENLFQKSFDWIRKNTDKKFFLFLHTYQTHGPYNSPAPFGQCFLAKDDVWKGFDLKKYLGTKGIFRPLPENLKKNIVALYDGEIRYMDEALIGPLLQGLKSLNLFDQTMIIFTSDHGEEFYDHGAWGHGHSLYNELIRVPLIIKFPSSKQKGQKIDSFARLIDVLPTVLEELKISYSARRFDGRSLFPLLDGKEKEPRDCLGEVYGKIEFPSPLRNASPSLRRVTINDNHFKLIFSINHSEYYHFFSPPPSRPETIEIQVYDLIKDPDERLNLASQKQDVIRRLLAKIESYYAEGKKGQRRGEPRTRSVDQSLSEQLRALGYLH